MSASDSHHHETTHDGTYCIYCGELMPETLEPSDSHRAEVRNKLKELIVDITVDHDSDTLEEVTDVYVDAIMALLDSERERWIGEVLTDILRYKKKDGTGWVIDAHIVADRLSKVLEGLQ